MIEAVLEQENILVFQTRHTSSRQSLLAHLGQQPAHSFMAFDVYFAIDYLLPFVLLAHMRMKK